MVGATLICKPSVPAPCTRCSCRLSPRPWPRPGPAVAQAAADAASTAMASACRGRRSFLFACLHASVHAGPNPCRIDRPLADSLEGMATLTTRPSLPALLPAPFEELLEQTLLL